MAARSRRFNSVNTSSPRFKARMGRVESRAVSSCEFRCASECEVTCACIIPSILQADPFSLTKQGHTLRKIGARGLGVLPRHLKRGLGSVLYICTFWRDSGCLKDAEGLHSATIRDPILRSRGMLLYMSEQYVETVIIGAGPIGLFQIFELGLLGISTHII